MLATSGENAPAGSVRRRARLRHPKRIFYGAATLLLVAYGLSLVLRPARHVWPVVDNELVDAFEIALALGCLARGLRRGPGRMAAVALGAGLLAWSMGDVVWTIQVSPPTPSIDDGFYLAFYPLAYLALMLLLRSQLGSVQPSTWLDGAIVGLGAAAICAAFAFDTILRAVGGSAASVAVNLAYPIGDLLLLGLAMAAIVVVPGRPKQLLLFAAGCTVMAVGDTIYLVQSSAGSYQVGTLLDLTWPTAILLMSVSIWVGTPDGTKAKALDRAPQFAIPALAAAAGLAILVLGSVQHVSMVGVGLAAAVLALTGVRRVMALRELRKITEARLHQAVTDELTGLDNRRQLLDVLDRSLTNEQRPPQSLALLLIDLDHFKEINDSFGHPTGDALLQQIGPRIRAVVRPDDVVGRLGGDEFAVVLRGSDVALATAAAQRITTAMDEPIAVERASLHIGASIGIAIAPTHAVTAAELLRCADVAMYRAKGAHSGFDIYEAALDDGADRLRLIEDLRDAIANNGLMLYYQPEIDLRSGKVVTVEALLRWQHPGLGLIPPEHFLALAGESGLIKPLTAWVLAEAVSDCARWWDAGHRVPVAVNLLATDLLDTELPERLDALLASARLPADALVVEITETMVMADLTRSKAVIQRLSDSGVRVSIDDFGTGFSSLAYLSDLAVGELKLDRMFTSRLQVTESGGRDEAIVRSAIDLGHALGLSVVAEGIERPEFVGLLAELGCDFGQGFAIQGPRPPADLDFGPFACGSTLAHSFADLLEG